jgi:hypothetical protein
MGRWGEIKNGELLYQIPLPGGGQRWVKKGA